MSISAGYSPVIVEKCLVAVEFLFNYCWKIEDLCRDLAD